MKKVFSTALALIMLVGMLFGTTAVSAATMPSCTGQRVSNVTTNSARVDFTIKNPSRLTVKTCGMQIRKKGTSKWTTKSETVASSYQKKNSIPGWYTVGKGKEFNYTLSAGTTYEYRAFCVYSNKTFYSGVATFTTAKNTPAPKTPLEKLKKKYPEGTKSTNCFTYADNAFRYLNSRTAKQVKKGLNGKTAWNNIKVGDVIHYYKSKKDPDYKYGSQHWAYVVAKSSDSITLAEGNYKGKVHYGRKISKSKFVNKNFYNLEIRR